MTNSTEAKAGTAPLSSNLKMLQLLDVLADSSGPVGVSQLARQVGASRSIVHRQLVTLVAAGWLENLDNGTYALTLRAIRIGQAALRHAGLNARIAERIAAAAEALGEVISLAAVDGDEIMVIERGVPTRGVRVTVSHGHRFPIIDSALGLVLTAYATPDEYQRLVGTGIELAGPTELESVRSHGYATVLDDEFDPIEVVAVPVGRAVGGVRYALSAHWPQGRTKVRDALSVLEPAARDLDDLISATTGLASA
ncbi:IclR family transcriptional regulator [Agromyces allii]|uniref:IclR family transcriptional regulator n=1 Tax=Agromyces allii TaxID=393607 RepID=A0ABN2R3U8_9MICO|nr:helix-turn-helix domain-containing protein [Agromyces allii]